MMHQAGLAAPERVITPEYLLDPPRLQSLLASQHTNWPVPDLSVGNKHWRHVTSPQAYHMATRGLYAGALVQRVDPQKRSLGTIFREEIALPLGLDFYIGNVPDQVMRDASPLHMADPVALAYVLGVPREDGKKPCENDQRVQLHPWETKYVTDTFLEPESFASRVTHAISLGQEPETIMAALSKAELPSSSGVASCAAMGRLGALLIDGSLDGVTVLPNWAQTKEQFFTTADSYEEDQTFGTEVRFTQGGLAEFTVDNHSDARVYGWGGGGGSMIYVQPELRMAMAFLTNSFGVRVAFADPRPRTLLASLFDSLLQNSAK